jgi:hypothetical protein
MRAGSAAWWRRACSTWRPPHPAGSSPQTTEAAVYLRGDSSTLHTLVRLRAVGSVGVQETVFALARGKSTMWVAQAISRGALGALRKLWRLLGSGTGSVCPAYRRLPTVLCIRAARYDSGRSSSRFLLPRTLLEALSLSQQACGHTCGGVHEPLQGVECVRQQEPPTRPRARCAQQPEHFFEVRQQRAHGSLRCGGGRVVELQEVLVHTQQHLQGERW